MGKTSFNTYMEIKKNLIQKFREEKFENNKLPSEAALAKELDISLVTLRESLMMLALEGFITKRHGSGNYVHPSALDPTNRIDLGITFADAFRQQGHEPGMQIIGIGETFAGRELADKFNIDETEVVSSCDIIYTADGLPSIYSSQMLPKTRLKKKFELGNKKGDFFEFIREYCDESITHSLNNYEARTLPEKIVDKLGLSKETPVIFCTQLYFNIQDEPVLYNEHYFHPDRFGVRMVQNWDLNLK